MLFGICCGQEHQGAFVPRIVNGETYWCAARDGIYGHEFCGRCGRVWACIAGVGVMGRGLLSSVAATTKDAVWACPTKPWRSRALIKSGSSLLLGYRHAGHAEA